MKHQPEIETAAGIIISLVGVAGACHSTLKMVDILEEGKEEVDKIKEGWETPENRELLAEHNYTEKDYKKELAAQYTKNAIAVVKGYAIPMAMIFTGYGLIIHGHVTLHKRNAVLLAGYKAVEEAFRSYRARVVEKYGKDEDLYFRHGVQKETITEEVQDSETGKIRKEKKEVYISGDGPSMYAKFFDESCRAWTKDPTANLCFLKGVQEWANTKLHAEGYLFLNEVYDAIGFPRTSAGAICGWIDGLGDSYVDFGMYELRNKDFINCSERTVLLDFNVDGVIFDKI